MPEFPYLIPFVNFSATFMPLGNYQSNGKYRKLFQSLRRAAKPKLKTTDLLLSCAAPRKFLRNLFLNSVMKHDLLSISANGLRACMSVNTLDLSFERLHMLNKKCTPTQVMLYQLSLSRYKIYNILSSDLDFETITVIDQMILTADRLISRFWETTKEKFAWTLQQINFITFPTLLV